MICLAGNLPALKVGRQKVVGYQTDWIDRALSRAATAAGREDCPFLAFLGEGVRHYLEKRCSLQLCPIETLFERMRAMLRKVGCPDIAAHLIPLAPPVTVSLIGPARRAARGQGCPFFKILNEEIRLLQESGAEFIRFCDIDESMRILRRSSPSPITRDGLKAEIIAFFEGRHHETSFPLRDLELTLEP